MEEEPKQKNRPAFVVLDSNVYLGDLTLRGIRFAALYDYLRKTKATLVQPRLVREEVVADYRRRLKAAAKKIYEAWGEYRYLMLSESIKQFRLPNLAYKERDLRSKLRGLSKSQGIIVDSLAEIGNVDLDELWLRGVHRIRPANEKGEELRDVLLWLIVLQYASSAKAHVAFVSSDGGFWAAGKPHPIILQDIEKRRVDVTLYPDLEHFNTANALSSNPIDPKQITNYVAEEKLTSLLLEALVKNLHEGRQGRFSSNTFKEPHLIKWTSTKAIIYEVGEHTEFAEWDMEIIAEAKMLTHQWANVATSFVGGLNPIQGGPSTFMPPNLGLGLMQNYAIPSQQFWGAGLTQSNFLNPAITVGGSIPMTPQLLTSENTVRVHAGCRVLTRIESSNITEIEVEAMKIEKIEEEQETQTPKTSSTK